LAPDDLQPSPLLWIPVLRQPFLVAAPTPEHATALQRIGVQRLSKLNFYMRHVLPQLAGLPKPASEAIAVQIMRELPLLQQADGSIMAALQKTKFVATSRGTLVSPGDLYDPR
jgi:hypothetical protein